MSIIYEDVNPLDKVIRLDIQQFLFQYVLVMILIKESSNSGLTFRSL